MNVLAQISRSAAPAKSLTITSSGKWNSMKGPLREPLVPPSEARRGPEANLRGDLPGRLRGVLGPSLNSISVMTVTIQNLPLYCKTRKIS
jgi:hypothetical protein